MNHVSIWRIKIQLRRRFWLLSARLGFRISDLEKARYIARNIARIRKELDDTGRKLRVGFIVCERAKWSAGPLFKVLCQENRYECGFITALSDVSLRLPKAARREHFTQNRNFFADLGDIWHDLYDSDQDRVRDVSSIDCDVVFIQQPWGMRDFPRQLSPDTLVAYVPYGFTIIDKDWMEFELSGFHDYLWKYFAQTRANAAIAKASTALGSPLPTAVVTAGYPKLDVYLTPPPERKSVTFWPRAKESTRKRVIFAPHHRIVEEKSNASTFIWSAQSVLNLARSHPEIDFILKPHPNFSFQMQRNKYLSADTYARWIEDWESLENTATFDSGDYFDLFRSSDIMITDSVSFLAEYLPTGQPIIYTLQPAKSRLNGIFQALRESLYCARTQQELDAVFAGVLIRGEDPLAKMRQEKIKQAIPFDEPSSQIVLCALEEIIAGTR